MKSCDELAIKIIFKLLRDEYGYDFHHYSQASIKRRVAHHVAKNDMQTIADIIPLLINDKDYFYELLNDLSITVTEMFRDPFFYKAFDKYVIPKLNSYPLIKFWHAGCSTGEEVYSMAILLNERNLLSKSRFYCTDFNPMALSKAKKGIFPANKYEQYAKNYAGLGLEGELDSYLTAKYEALKIKHFLREKMMFAVHNLAVDSSFGQVEVIICRNVMIYFDGDLRDRVLRLFKDSLVTYGFLCLGSKESIDDPNFECIDFNSAIYRKIPYVE